MPYTKITNDLSDTIKNLRSITKTTAADLAKAISRSSGYISNLENGKTSQIELSELFKIFNFFKNKNDECDIIITQFLDKGILPYLSKAETREQEEFIRFDKQFRKIKIPKSFIEYIKSELQQSSLTSFEIMEEVNSNRYIDNPDQYKKNVIVIIQDERGIGERIIFDLDEKFLQDILDGKITSTNYINLDGLLYGLYLKLGYDVETALKNAHHRLIEDKIYTFEERKRLIKEENVGLVFNRPNLDSTHLPDDVNEFYDISKKIFDILEVLNDVNPEYTLNKLQLLYNNLQQPKSRDFTLGCLGLPFNLTETLSQAERKQLYKDIHQLITERCKSNNNNNIDTIDTY